MVRSGLERWLQGRRIHEVTVLDPRSVRRHLPGAEDFQHRLQGAQISQVVRRGKFLWMPLRFNDNPGAADAASDRAAEDTALVAHLGMSGQLLVHELEHDAAADSGSLDPGLLGPAAGPPVGQLAVPRHLKIRYDFPADSSQPGYRLDFVDQRIFGGMFLSELVPTRDGLPGGFAGAQLAEPLIPADVAHIARDPLDENFSMQEFSTALRRRRTGLKRALLDQGLVSGIGNIYADEALWASSLHYELPTEKLSSRQIEALLEAARAVMRSALAAGGTSFDSLYVNVNGSSGYFERSLEAYGREDEPCSRCGTPIKRESFMNRSSHFCPKCQPKPRLNS